MSSTEGWTLVSGALQCHLALLILTLKMQPRNQCALPLSVCEVLNPSSVDVHEAESTTSTRHAAEPNPKLCGSPHIVLKMSKTDTLGTPRPTRDHRPHRSAPFGWLSLGLRSASRFRHDTAREYPSTRISGARRLQFLHYL